MEDEYALYSFKDFYLTAFLLCGFAELIKIRDSEDGLYCIFDLRSKVNVEQIIRDYYNDRMLINPALHKRKIIDLKSALYEHKKEKAKKK